MAFERRLINGRSSNAGLVALTGAAGRGFADAGKSIANLGLNISKNDRQDKMLEDARTEAYKNRDATASYNATVNPEVAKTMTKEQLGRVKLTAPIAKETQYKTIGNQIINLDTKQPVYTVPTQVTFDKSVRGDDGYFYNQFSNGQKIKTDVKFRDWNASRDTDIPSGFVASKTFNGNLASEATKQKALKAGALLNVGGKYFYNHQKFKAYSERPSDVNDKTI